MIWKLDRLARSIAQLIETVNRLEKGGVELRSLTESIDTGTAGGRLSGKFIRDWMLENRVNQTSFKATRARDRGACARR